MKQPNKYLEGNVFTMGENDEQLVTEKAALEAIQIAQKEAYNEAIEDAAKSAAEGFTSMGADRVRKNILKLKK